MKEVPALHVIALSALLGCLVPGLSNGQGTPKAPPSSDQPLKAAKNPPGDIPDNQVFVDYRSPLGFSIKAPEGWARSESANGVTFSDKYNVVNVNVGTRGTA